MPMRPFRKIHVAFVLAAALAMGGPLRADDPEAELRLDKSVIGPGEEAELVVTVHGGEGTADVYLALLEPEGGIRTVHPDMTLGPRGRVVPVLADWTVTPTETPYRLRFDGDLLDRAGEHTWMLLFVPPDAPPLEEAGWRLSLTRRFRYDPSRRAPRFLQGAGHRLVASETATSGEASEPAESGKAASEPTPARLADTDAGNDASPSFASTERVVVVRETVCLPSSQVVVIRQGGLWNRMHGLLYGRRSRFTRRHGHGGNAFRLLLGDDGWRMGLRVGDRGGRVHPWAYASPAWTITRTGGRTHRGPFGTRSGSVSIPSLYTSHPVHHWRFQSQGGSRFQAPSATRVSGR